MKSLVAVGCALALVSVQAAYRHVDLAVRGKGALPVAIAADAAPSVKYAAEEYAKYAERICGEKVRVGTADGTLPCVRIAIDAKAGADEFRIKASEGGVAITGGKRGVLYGVYEVLERFGGCGWFSSMCEVVPKRDVLAMPDDFDFEDRPVFDQRYAYWYDSGRNPEFAAKLRITNPKQDERFGGYDFRFDKKLAKSHTFKWLVPADRYFKDHPEYFSLYRGKRDPDKQLCLTNPDVFRIVTEKTLNRIRASYPGVKMYGISQNDARPFPCECEACRAIDEREGSPSGSMIWFVNKVAEAVEREFPDVTIETLAYTYTRVPPRTLKVRKNVMPCLCTIECDMAKPFDVSTCDEDVAFVTNLVRWGEISPRVMIWDYVTDFIDFCFTFPNVESLQRNLAFLSENGVRQYFGHGDNLGPHGDFAELKAYLMGKWMWNPKADRETLLRTFFEGYYGKAAAPHVRQYYDELHAFEWTSSTQGLSCYASCCSADIPDSFFPHARELWQRAKVAVRDDPQRLKNVSWGAFSVDYTEVMRYLGSADGYPYNLKRGFAADPKRFAEVRDVARGLLPFLEEEPPVRLSENEKRSARRVRAIRELAERERPTAGADVVRIPGWEFTRAGPLKRMIGFGEFVPHDPGVAYRVRAFVRRGPDEKRPAAFTLRLGGKDFAPLREQSAPDETISKDGVWVDGGEWIPGSRDTISFDAENADAEFVEVSRADVRLGGMKK